MGFYGRVPKKREQIASFSFRMVGRPGISPDFAQELMCEVGPIIGRSHTADQVALAAMVECVLPLEGGKFNVEDGTKQSVATALIFASKMREYLGKEGSEVLPLPWCGHFVLPPIVQERITLALIGSRSLFPFVERISSVSLCVEMEKVVKNALGDIKNRCIIRKETAPSFVFRPKGLHQEKSAAYTGNIDTAFLESGLSFCAGFIAARKGPWIAQFVTPREDRPRSRFLLPASPLGTREEYQRVSARAAELIRRRGSPDLSPHERSAGESLSKIMRLMSEFLLAVIEDARNASIVLEGKELASLCDEAQLQSRRRMEERALMLSNAVMFIKDEPHTTRFPFTLFPADIEAFYREMYKKDCLVCQEELLAFLSVFTLLCLARVIASIPK